MSVQAALTQQRSATPPDDRAAAALHDLRRDFGGALQLPGDPGYDAQRATWSGAVDPWPAIVAQARNAADVRVAVTAARERDLPFAVQSTGHGTHVACHGGLLLKTGRMATVFVDPDRCIARVGPGARWSQVIAAAAPFGLAPLAGSSPEVGVAGYTLGGGVGWLARRFGFAADSLLRADVVTADGRVRTADADEHSDLFWALRGGGGNFGVVAGLELRLHPVGEVYAGTALFPIDRAADVLGFYRDWALDGQPDALTTNLVLLRTSPDPRVTGPVLAIRGVFAGGAGAGRRALRSLWDVAGPALVDAFRPGVFADTAAIGGTAPRSFELFAELPDAVIDAAIAAIAGPDATAQAVDVRAWGGAMARPGADAGPVGHRDVPFSITVDGPPAAAAPLAAHATGGSFLNFLQDTRRTHTAYTGRDHWRLRQIKRAYDPDNVMGATHNIAPGR